MTADALTIGRLARAAAVNIETIRYYQRRIRFIKRAQELGFSLREIDSLLALQDGTHRRAIRKLAGDRLTDIRDKLADLKRMERVLTHLVHECETTGEAHPCPIIAALADTPPASSNGKAPRRRGGAVRAA
jgi:DNA-binding transcriptional MerR regulator